MTVSRYFTAASGLVIVFVVSAGCSKKPDAPVVVEPGPKAAAAELKPSPPKVGEAGRDIYLYDLAKRQYIPLPGLNSPNSEQSPSLSADWHYVAFVSERLDGAGEKDVYLYDRQKQTLVPLPELNSKQDDFDPCVVVLP